MRLLIITQKADANDSNLGFFHRWIEGFAKRCEKVTVICLYEGTHTFPANVRVLSLGKESGVSRLKYLCRFFSYISKERGNYDAVFVHMNPIYLVLGGVFWRVWRKRIGLWYTHGHVDLKLRLAEKLAHIIFTASSESFRIKSKKVRVTGHGIDIEALMDRGTLKPREENDVLRLTATGRIAPSKRLDLIIKAIEIMKKEGVPLQLSIIGGPTSATEKEYQQRLETYVSDHVLGGEVRFVGPVPYDDIGSYLRETDLFISMSDTGSMDKVILEALALEVPVITSNIAYRTMLSEGGFIEESTAERLAKMIKAEKDIPYSEDIRRRLSQDVREHHDLRKLIDTLVHELSYVRN